MKIRILAVNRTSRGPGMVYKNLEKGLKKLGVEIDEYPLRLEATNCDHIVCLSDPEPWEEQGVLPESISLVGPNNWEIPIERIANKYNNFVVPSQWVKDLYLSFDFMKDKNIHVWPVGIDTDEWPKADPSKKIGDCLIYFKGIEGRGKDAAVELCMDKGLSFGSLTYGSYSEEALHEAVQQCKFAMLVTRTESQGIAVQQILASGLPCFVFEKEQWNDRDDGLACSASAVPYWDDRCGVKVREGASREEIYEAFTYFLENLDNFDPRGFIEENLTLEHTAQKFIDILKVV